MRNNSENNDFGKDLISKLKTFLLEIVSIVIDACFLALWVLVEWALDQYVIKPLVLSGISQWVLSTFQIVFSASTLIVVLSYVVVDVVTILVRNWRKIKSEATLGKVSNITAAQSQGESQ